MKKLNYLVAAAGIAGLLFTTTPQSTYKGFEEPKAYAEAKETVQKLEDLVIKKGVKFSITLSAHPSSGYGWDESFNTEYFQLLDKKFVPYDTLSDLNYNIPSELVPCAQEKEIFEFLALESGKTEIMFSYCRPWEKDKQPLDKKIFVIKIE